MEANLRSDEQISHQARGTREKIMAGFIVVFVKRNVQDRVTGPVFLGRHLVIKRLRKTKQWKISRHE